MIMTARTEGGAGATDFMLPSGEPHLTCTRFVSFHGLTVPSVAYRTFFNECNTTFCPFLLQHNVASTSISSWHFYGITFHAAM
jgi:hypothetical protein